MTLGGGLEVAHESVERHIESEELLAEEAVGHFAGVVTVAETGGANHVVYALVSGGGDRRPL